MYIYIITIPKTFLKNTKMKVDSTEFLLPITHHIHYHKQMQSIWKLYNMNYMIILYIIIPPFMFHFPQP